MQLRPYQTDAVNSIFEYFGEKKGNPVLCCPTGSGKAVILADFVKKVLSYWPSQRILMVTHIKELVEQNAEKLLRMWPDAPLGIYSAGLNKKESFAPIVFGGVGSIVNNIEDIGFRDLMICDECHMIGQKDSSMYRVLIDKLREINPKMKVIGLTATPFRLGQGMITDDGIFTDICFDLTKLEAFNKLIKDGYLCPLIPKRTATQLDVSSVGISNGDYKQNELQKAVDVNEITYRAIQEVLEQGADRNCWMFFASGVEHAEHITECLQSFGISAVCVHSKMPTKQRDDNIRDFKAGIHRAIVGNNVLTTGFDHPPIDLIAFLRPTTSPGLWCLDEETEVLTDEGWKNYESISVGDSLPSFSIATQSGVESKVLNKIHRPMYDDEFFVEIKNQNVDICVTNKHDLIVSTRSGRNHLRSDYRKVNAQECVNFSDFHTPSSITLDNELELTDDQIRFIGLFMTDGTLDKSNNQITIYQSAKNPDVQKYIDRVFEGCGFALRKRITGGDVCFGKIRENDMTRWYVSHGVSRKYKTPGWGVIEKYISKDFPLELFKLSNRQFEILLEAINAGDGSKNDFGQYKRETFEISKGNRSFAERLAACAVIHGHSAVIKESKEEWRKQILFQIHIKKQNYRNIKKQDVSFNMDKKSFVWCVETTSGTIITKRNGKISVLGNCQCLGRGTRPFNSKENCLVLDFSGNTARLGPINDPVIPKKRGKTTPGEVPVKLCPQCGIYYHSSVRTCSACGYEFPRYTKLQTQASEAELIKTLEPEIRFFDIDRTIYAKHQKPGAPASLRVTYFSGIKKFEEFVCLEHQGFARKKAADWWLKRISEKIPSCVDEALSYISELRKVRRIEVIVNRKYPEIINHEF